MELAMYIKSWGFQDYFRYAKKPITEMSVLQHAGLSDVIFIGNHWVLLSPEIETYLT